LAAGLFYIAPMTAVIVGELFGHFFSTSPYIPPPFKFVVDEMLIVR
jgi:hypothetical protein